MVKDCPKCGLVNPPDAQRCDCGYDFVSRRTEQSYLGSAATAERFGAPTGVEVAVCIIFPLIGLIMGYIVRRQGRLVAGNRMMLVSGIALAVCNGPFILLMVVQAIVKSAG